VRASVVIDVVLRRVGGFHWLWRHSGACKRQEGNGAGDSVRPREGSKALKGTTP
jgi:hypothetical protein